MGRNSNISFGTEMKVLIALAEIISADYDSPDNVEILQTFTRARRIQEKCGVSKSGTREALMRLEDSGMVESHMGYPHTRMYSLSEEDCRIVLELAKALYKYGVI